MGSSRLIKCRTSCQRVVGTYNWKSKPQPYFPTRRGETIMTHTFTFEPLLTIADIMRIFCVSQITVYRWLDLARQGKHPLPLPIGDGIGNRKQKRRLRWSREAILAYLNASNPQASPTTESAAQRQRRHSSAMSRLKAKGVRIVTPKQHEVRNMIHQNPKTQRGGN